MEVDAVSFPHHLLGLLVAISEADFVAFDLEYSGIPGRMPGRAARQGTGRATLEDRYAETKAGAERYSILQFGITCARFDYIANKYVLRPYNVNLSPLLDERLDIERDVTFQTGAAAFLMNNGFQMELPWTKGVPYLSREEAVWAKRRAYDRADKKNAVADLQLKIEDVDSLDFVRRAREEITKFKTSNSRAVEITTHTGLKEQPTFPAISRFEKRLVHQLIRAEFPEFVSIPKPDCILVKHFDAMREADNTAKQKRLARERIANGTGFRWVFEALAQGDIDPIDPFYFAKNPRGMVIAADINNIKDRFDRTAQRLKDQQPVLVGHNMFTDLVYLYQCFVGKLPDTLQGFCEAIHDLFPKIVDTKYLATFAGGDLNASPTLQDIAEGLEKQKLPDIVTHADHGKYHNTKAFHEAGYDSLLTATVMLRLSAKVDVDRQEKLGVGTETDTDVSFKDALEEQGGVSLIDDQDKILEPVTLPPIADLSASIAPSDLNTPLEGIDDPKEEKLENLEKPDGKKKKKKSKKRKNKGTVNEKTTDGKFSSSNLFDRLQELSLNSETGGDWEAMEQPERQQGSAWKDVPYLQDKTGWMAVETMEREPMELMPEFDSEFWQEFGNKLRIFGTQELVLKIADWPGSSTK
ncbi:CAF1-domain-containing protein [Melanomma pulvis-pyrius CBS 109.77]|uniref:CAF1-domain-containing protein n=1 Tax=Melanomma pulvis-pyrius CBS 109.77 TaxID=1314802 RepID=A0A6A6XRI0_9PLEO|nr:CAF1-domain-containing protein [Melanomma pulvis-pyrius CBS 109.77]